MKKMLLVGGVAAALALSACGSSTPAARKATLKAYVASLGASPDLQVTVKGSFTGAGSTKAQQILKALTFGMNFSSTNGAPLSQAGANVNTEITAVVNGKTFLDIRQVSKNLYFKLDATALGSIPGVKISPSEIAAVQLVFGGRWFVLPQTTLNSIVPHKNVNTAKAVEDRAVASKIIDDITNLIDTTPYKSLSNGGYSETGSIYSVAKAIYPTLIAMHDHVKMPTASQAKGSFTLGVTTSGSNASGASLSVTAPNAKKGTATASISFTFAHASQSVSAPSSSTPLPTSLLREFAAGASSSSSSSSSQ